MHIRMTDAKVFGRLKSFKRKFAYIAPKSHKVIIGGKVWDRCILEMEITASFVKRRKSKP